MANNLCSKILTMYNKGIPFRIGEKLVLFIYNSRSFKTNTDSETNIQGTETQVHKIGTMYGFLYSLSYVDIKSFLKEVRSDVLMFLKLYFLLSFSSYLY